ncbi:MAG: hypothetical protein ACYCX3_16080 [Thermoleophilia bacterium]
MNGATSLFQPAERVRLFGGLRQGLRLAWVDDDTLAIEPGAVQFSSGAWWSLPTQTNYTFSILDTGVRAQGVDYAVFATPSGPKLTAIATSHAGEGLLPSGFTRSQVALLGYFHNGKDFSGGGADGAIFRYSITSNDLLNYTNPYRAHPELRPGIPLPGMVKVGGLAIGIYMASHEDATAAAVGTSAYPTSRYGVVPWHTIQGWDCMAALRNVGCRLPSWEEWLGCVEWNPGSTTPARMNGNTAYGSSSDDTTTYLAAPGALTSALAGAGAGLLGNGLYKYQVTLVNATGETQAGTANVGTTVADYTTNGQIALSAIPVGAAGTTARKIYRTVAGGATYKLLATIPDNTTTVYTDNIADASLGANAPGSNTTGSQQGTIDPTQAGRTLVGTGPRTTVWTSTKTARSWYSPAGLADPVGNCWELVAEFFGGLRGGWAGVGGAVGGSTQWSSGAGYNEGDAAYNFLGQAYNPDSGGYTEGLPALLIVGGAWSNVSSAGVRAAYASYGPGGAGAGIGFRSAR